MSGEQFINGRIVGGHSRFAAELPDDQKPDACKSGHHHWRCVDCCNHAGDERDIDECSECGRQINVRCNFDEEYS